VKLPFREDVVAADVQTYAALGIHHLTSFAAWIDADYVKRFKISASSISTVPS
jgi:hypothetical protein